LQRSGQIACPRAPIESGENGLVDLQGIHQRDDVDCDHRRLTIAHGAGRKKARRAITPQIGHDHVETLRRQQRRDIDKAVDVVRPAMQKQHRRAVRRARLGVTDIQQARIDLPERGEGFTSFGFRHAPLRGHVAFGLRSGEHAQAELDRGHAQCRPAEKTATLFVDVIRRLDLAHY
jgi:hypothetical protein